MSRFAWSAGLLMSVVAFPPRAAEGQLVSAPVIAPASSGLMAGGQTLPKVPTAVALTITTPSTVFYGQVIDGLAQVTSTDGSSVTGTVTFYDGATGFCTLTLVDGASCPAGTETGFAAGSHVFTATYSGDGTHAGATSNAVTVTVQPDTTATTLATSANPVPAASGVIYTASVAGAHGSVSGTVAFLDGTSSMGSATLDNNGTATLSVLMVTPGSHAVTAVFAGNSNSAGSTSAVLNEVVQAALVPTTTTITASANPAVTGQSITFTATVSASSAAQPLNGTVTFVEGGTALGTAAVPPTGAAVWSTSGLSTGSHSIVARYAGDPSSAPSISAPLTEVINDPAPSDTFSISVDQITVVAGETALVPVKVIGGSGFAKAISLSCSGLPAEASCSGGMATGASAGTSTLSLKISTAAPRDCGSSTPYGSSSPSASLPIAGPVLAGLLLTFAPKRRRAIKGLFAALCAVTAMAAMTGCGTGNCTDLGTRPGTYTITVTGSTGGAQVSQKVKLIVKP